MTTDLSVNNGLITVLSLSSAEIKGKERLTNIYMAVIGDFIFCITCCFPA